MGNDAMRKTVGISNIRMRMFLWIGSNPHERWTRSGFKKTSSLVKSFGSSRVQVF